ncbi:MAG: sigma-70 family RNA polymerase sigma factor [Firmicutes bacterium]|nr:sigma-70 family RNA polymerase sigma factor [Bacillota bacterium]
MSSPEDNLIAKARSGSVAAFEQLVYAYEKRVYNLALRMMGNPDDASDVAQEAFLRAYSSLREFRGDSSFSTWLYRIVSNICLDELRRRKRQRVSYLDEPIEGEDGEMTRQVAAPAPGPEEVIEEAEVRELVQRGIALLPEDHRIIVVLRDLQGLSYEEISQTLGLNLGTVKSRLNRARAALKDRLSASELFTQPIVESTERGAGK